MTTLTTRLVQLSTLLNEIKEVSAQDLMTINEDGTTETVDVKRLKHVQSLVIDMQHLFPYVNRSVKEWKSTGEQD